jgi:hypothetical protein
MVARSAREPALATSMAELTLGSSLTTDSALESSLWARQTGARATIPKARVRMRGFAGQCMNCGANSFPSQLLLRSFRSLHCQKASLKRVVLQWLNTVLAEAGATLRVLASASGSSCASTTHPHGHEIRPFPFRKPVFAASAITLKLHHASAALWANQVDD